MRRTEKAASDARQVERAAYGMVSDAADDAELKEARDVLRLATGLRRMLERIVHRADGDAGIGPATHRAQER